MRMTRRVASIAVGACVAWAGIARADVKIEERSRMKMAGAVGGLVNRFAGDAARDGETRTVAVKGDRKRSLGPSGGEIVDLAEEKIYRLDARGKTYEVVTFDALRKQAERAKAEARRGKDEPAPDRAEPRESDTEVDVDVKETGEKKVVNGFEARQVVTTITVRKKGQTLEQGGGTVLVSDGWLAKGVKAQDEVAAFDRRYYRKLFGKDAAAAAGELGALAATNPGLGPAMERLGKESGKLKGFPVLTTTTVETVNVAKKDEPESGGGGLGGMLGRKLAKKVTGDGASSPRQLLLTSSVEILSVSGQVSADDVAMPAGFRQR